MRSEMQPIPERSVSSRGDAESRVGALRELAVLVAEARSASLLERSLALARRALGAKAVLLFRRPGALRGLYGLAEVERSEALIRALGRLGDDLDRDAGAIREIRRLIPGVDTVRAFRTRGDRRPRERMVVLFPSSRGSVSDELGEVVASLVGTALGRLESLPSEIQFADVVEHAAEVILITDPRGRILYVNQAFESITGFPRDEAIGRTPSMLKSGAHERAFYDELWETIRQGRVWSGEFTNRRKDGRLYRESAVISPILGDDGQIVQFLKVMRDVTEERRLEKQLRRTQRLEAIGTLAGGIAHDFNNILTAVLGYSDLLQRGSENEVAFKYGQEIERAARRARHLVGQILTFSRHPEEEEGRTRRPVRLEALVQEVVGLLRVGLPQPIRFRLDLEDDLAVLADPTQIHQVLMNLCTNAAQAMSEGGLLEISARLAPSGPKLEPGTETIRLAVRDTGSGIASDDLERIFDPYFTTKKKGEGTGLGLSVVHGIVGSLGGRLDVASQPGEGTEVVVWLPAAPMSTEVREWDPGAAHSGNALEGRETVFIVDDETQILESFELALARLGYVVRAFPAAEEALHALVTDAPPDLLITDQNLRGMSGLQLVRLLRERGDAVPTLLCTGVRERIVLQACRELGILRVLVKPVTPSELCRAIREAIGVSNREVPVSNGDVPAAQAGGAGAPWSQAEGS